MLILSNEEIESFLSIESCIDALERAYRSWDQGKAINRPRTDLVLPSANEGGVYAFKSMEAGLYDPPVVALRINSDIIRWNQQGSRVTRAWVWCCFSRRSTASLSRFFPTASSSACAWPRAAPSPRAIWRAKM